MKARLSHHMASIICILVELGRSKADNFVRSALGVLAEKGLINIVEGFAELTELGHDHVQAAEKIVRKHYPYAVPSHASGCACDPCIANQIPKHPW